MGSLGIWRLPQHGRGLTQANFFSPLKAWGPLYIKHQGKGQRTPDTPLAAFCQERAWSTERGLACCVFLFI